MATVFDVAKYILDKRGEMSTMKLQKLCFYSQAWSLAWEEGALFNEDFQAWANGPVCPVLFYQTQGLFFVSAKDEPGDISNLSETSKQTIDKVLDYYGDKTAQWLSQLTHMETPWQAARNGLPPGVGSDNVITKESMAMYYGSL